MLATAEWNMLDFGCNRTVQIMLIKAVQVLFSGAQIEQKELTYTWKTDYYCRAKPPFCQCNYRCVHTLL